MPTIHMLHTPRLTLRPWRDEDLDAFAALNCDAEVMRYYPYILTREQSGETLDWYRNMLEHDSFGPWVLERRTDSRFLGVAGLWRTQFQAAFTPSIEVGWRLFSDVWGQGYATEAGQCCLAFGFHVLDLSEIISYTPRLNQASRRVMEKLGMQEQLDAAFLHPDIDPANPLAQQVLYHITRDAHLLRQVHTDPY